MCTCIMEAHLKFCLAHICKNFCWFNDCHNYPSGVNQHLAVRNTEGLATPVGSILYFLVSSYLLASWSEEMREQKTELRKAMWACEALGEDITPQGERWDTPSLGGDSVSHSHHHNSKTVSPQGWLPGGAACMTAKHLALRGIQAWFTALLPPPWNS